MKSIRCLVVYLALMFAIVHQDVAAAQTTQTPFNHHSAKRSTIFYLDFEQSQPEPVPVTTNADQVIAGSGSLRLSRETSSFQLPSDLRLEPARTYVVEYDYKVLQAGADNNCSAGAAFVVPGLDPIVPSTQVNAGTSATGHASTGLRLGWSPQTFLVFYALDCDVAIDNIEIWRQDVEVRPAAVPLWTIGFPRIAALVDVTSGHVDDTFARYDLLLASGADHTLGSGAAIARLRALNPLIRILPYHTSFVAREWQRPVVGENAGLTALFNKGLQDGWFLADFSRARIPLDGVPSSFLLNPTQFLGRDVQGRLHDYDSQFISSSVLASGLWDGVYFGGVAWRPPQISTPIDLDRDGQPESPALLSFAWLDGFISHFRQVFSRLGFTQILMGDAGRIPLHPTVLPLLNGWLTDATDSYEITAGGAWNLDDASGWYQLQETYLAAGAQARAPQALTLNFTDAGILRPDTSEAGGLDLRRMRLGLTTTLLGNGFFSYTSEQQRQQRGRPFWFDEYAVDSNGVATTNLDDKGYLGQPLGAASEIEMAGRPLLDVHYLLAHRDSAQSSSRFFTTHPSSVPLIAGKTYQLTVDYRVLDYAPETLEPFLKIGISRLNSGAKAGQTAALHQSDVGGYGQAGRLRSVVKVRDAESVAWAALGDRGSILADRIQLTEGAAAWRRDFENGVVLVNPTPDAMTISMEQIAGPLGRSGIQRILGSQDAEWNTGQVVDGRGITLPPGDGIILLANRIVAPALTSLDGMAVAAAGNSAVVMWRKTARYVAGYHIVYGEHPFQPTRSAAAASDAPPFLEITGLNSATAYYFRIAAFDFYGNIGPYTPPVVFVTPPVFERRPEFSFSTNTGAIAPGALMTIDGVNLANTGITIAEPPFPVALASTAVFVNDLPAPLRAISPSRIDFVVPWEVAGPNAVVHVIRDGVRSSDVLVSLHSAVPKITGIDSAYRDGSPIRTDEVNPLKAGDVVILTAEGLGLVEPPPLDGAAPAGLPPVALGRVSVTVNEIPSPRALAFLSPLEAGKYQVEFVVPFDLAPGSADIRLQVNGVNSNAFVGYFN